MLVRLGGFNRFLECLLMSCVCYLLCCTLASIGEVADNGRLDTVLSAEERADADALLAQHGRAALAYYQMWEDRDKPKELVVAKVQYLLAKDVDVNFKGNDGFTLLHLAADYGNLDVIKLLLDHGADVNARNVTGETPLHCVRNIGSAKLLVAHGADVNARNDFAITPLHIIPSIKENIDLFEFLVSQGADIHAKDYTNYTPLHYVGCVGCVEIAQFLVNKGAVVKPIDKTTLAPFHAAVNQRLDAKMISFFADQGVDVNEKDSEGNYPIHLLVKRGSVAAVKQLVDLGANFNAIIDQSKSTTLHVATEYNPDVEVTKYLISLGLDVHAKDKYGYTPLHLASERYDNIEVIRYLVMQGADVKAVTNHGQTPLHMVKNVDVAKLFIEKGADIHAKNNNGSTPLHYAAEANKNEQIFNLLVSKGGDPKIRNNEGLTPNDLRAQRRSAMQKDK